MELHVVDIHELTIPDNRQRREFKGEELVKLANSISQNGLIHPCVIRRGDRGELILVAGERRVKAMMYVWNFGQVVRCGEHEFAEGQIPCIYQGEMDPLDAFEMELEENIRRVDLTWQERSQATSQLYELRRLQAEKRGLPAPTIADISAEVRGESGSSADYTRKELLVSRHLDDPDVGKAKTVDEAFKILKRKEENRKNAELAGTIGLTYTADLHTLLQGDCLEILPTLTTASFDVILTDPPYGIDADQYGDSGGKTYGAHFYDDSFASWRKMMLAFLPETFRLAKPQAHLYIFCDIDNFIILRDMVASAGWKPFRTPIVWNNPTAMRVPWIESGPQRKYQLCLYANKGDRRVNQIYPDLVTYPSDDNLGHQAQKPVALFGDLLLRSIRPGDTVLDPFCGTGPIFPAAHALRCVATGIELDAAACGIVVKRLTELKEKS